MRSAFASIFALLLGVAVLLLGAGMLGTLLGLRMSIGGASPLSIGAIMAAYFAGLIVGSLWAQTVVASVGHIRAFATFAAIFSAACLTHALSESLAVWTLLRLIEGFCMAGLLMVTESWLNAKATNATRGKIMAWYMVAIYLSQGLGQFFLLAAEPHGFALFAVASILASLALVPIAATRVAAPDPPEPVVFGVRRLAAISPLGIAGAFASGLLLGALYAMTPVYAERSGLAVDSVVRLMSVTILGGLLLQWPIGRASDRFDRRHVITVLSIAIALVSLGIALLGHNMETRVLGLAIFGGVAFALYPLAIAHANDYLEPRDVVGATGGLLLAYSVGATLGPLGAAGTMAIVGPHGLFIFTGAVGAATAAFTLWRIRRRTAVPLHLQGQYRPLPTTTPQLAHLDPRYEPPKPAAPYS